MPESTKVRDYLITSIESMLERPPMWGDSSSNETLLLHSLELLHLIDFPECQIRCGWNCHVGYLHNKHRVNCDLVTFHELRGKLANPAFIQDLTEIWKLWQSKHPHPDF